MLVLDNSCIWCLSVRIVHNSNTLIVLLVKNLCLKSYCSVLKLAEAVAEVLIYRACINNGLSKLVVVRLVLKIINACLNVTALKELVNDNIIASDRDTLVQIVKVVVVIYKSYRKSLDYERRKILAVSSPLLLCVALNKLLVYISSHKADGLLLKVLRLTCYNLLLLIDYSLCLFRCGYSPHLAEGVHVERKVVCFTLVICNRAVCISVKLTETVYIVPYLSIAGMENMGAILVDMYSFHVLTVHISTYVVSLLHNQY